MMRLRTQRAISISLGDTTSKNILDRKRKVKIKFIAGMINSIGPKANSQECEQKFKVKNSSFIENHSVYVNLKRKIQCSIPV